MTNTRSVGVASAPPKVGRLISITTGGPAQNMAMDQALLESVSHSGIPVLRFYQWSLPTLSLGYFQRVETRADHAESGGISCIRRATGGGAIVHDRELTYSIVIPVSAGQAGQRPGLYRQIHSAIAASLTCLGVSSMPYRLTVPESYRATDSAHFLCFQRRTAEDLIVSGYKILGSAQRKTRTAVLQHGSLLLQASGHAPQLPGISDLLSKPLVAEEIAALIVENLTVYLGIQWQKDGISQRERSDSELISAERFGSSNWTNRR